MENSTNDHLPNDHDGRYGMATAIDPILTSTLRSNARAINHNNFAPLHNPPEHEKIVASGCGSINGKSDFDFKPQVSKSASHRTDAKLAAGSQSNINIPKSSLVNIFISGQRNALSDTLSTSSNDAQQKRKCRQARLAAMLEQATDFALALENMTKKMNVESDHHYSHHHHVKPAVRRRYQRRNSFVIHRRHNSAPDGFSLPNLSSYDLSPKCSNDSSIMNGQEPASFHASFSDICLDETPEVNDDERSPNRYGSFPDRPIESATENSAETSNAGMDVE